MCNEMIIETNKLKKIVVIGDSCSGKTTLARDLSKKLGIKHIELDSLFWEGNWKNVDTIEFKKRITSALQDTNFITDGNFSMARDVIWDKTDTIIWIDLPIWIILTRFFSRSISRSLKKELLWGKCQETLRKSIFSKDSLFMWIISTHYKRKRTYSKIMKDDAYSHINFIRLNSAKEVNKFIKQISDLRPQKSGV